MNLQINGSPQTEMARKVLWPQRPFNPLFGWRAGLTPSLRLFRSFASISIFLLLFMACAGTARAQGALTNGWTHTGTIAPIGDSDSWTFSVTSGDTLVIRVGEITQTNSFTPRIRLFNPGATQIALASGAVAAEIVVAATNTGTFTVIVDDALGTTATGTYRLTLAKTPGAVLVAPGDEGGPLTNGVMHTGTISTGDLDVWTFTASAGQAIVVRVGEITDNTGNFEPWVRLYSPTGALLGSGFGAVAGEVTVTAASSGTFIVVVGDGNSALSGTGTYRLTLAKTGDPVVVSSGDEGGPMTNSVMHTGTISTGDLDLWTFTASSGQALVVRMGEITDNTANFTPWVRLYSPTGTLLDSGFGASAGEVTATAGSSGTYLVVVGDGNSALSGTGTYRLTLAKTGDPVVISAGDDGGPMTNGATQAGTILTGDLDVWTFTANSGEAIVVRVGQITDTNAFTPWLRLYSPGGTLLSSGFGASAGEVTATAATSGTFIVVVGDGNSAFSGSGDYRLTLGKTGGPIVVSAGDEGGPLTAGVNPLGTISLGDLDVYSFTICKGENMHLRVDKLTDTSGNFTPWLRLYAGSGALVGSSFGATAAELNLTAGSSGTFIAIVSDGNSTLSGTGTYSLTTFGLSDELRLCVPFISGTNANLSGVGGTTNAPYMLFTTTNAGTPTALWTPIRTNQFDGFGVFVYTNLYNSNEFKRFFRLRSP